MGVSNMPNPQLETSQLSRNLFLHQLMDSKWWLKSNKQVLKIGGIKYTNSTIRNQSIIQKSFSSFIGFKMVIDEQQTGFQYGGFLKNSQLHKCGFAYIWYYTLM
jgi:hypothetical protein